MNNPMNELWQAQQDAAAQFTDGWRKLLQPAADRTTRAPAPPEADDPAAETVDTGSDDPADIDTAREDVEPEPEFSALDVFRAIQALGEGQRDFADHMIRWAELQHALADTLTSWASEQRERVDALNHLLAPFSPGTVDQQR
jgi:hypothetical protein